MNCPYMEFLFDGNYVCELSGDVCDGLSCEANEFEDDSYADDDDDFPF